MKQTFFKQKIKAFLHDPPEKPLILGLEGHENRAKHYLHTLIGGNEKFDKEEWAFADHVASAADRASFPMRETHEFQVNFRKPEHSKIVHPNSGRRFKLGGFQDIDAKQVQQHVDAAMGKISALSGGDYEKMFIYLWRCLPEMISYGEEGNDTLGKLWRYLPADTRIPDHSVHDHARVVSAFAGAGVHKDKVSASLLLFTIGPVQEFIAAARKTSDLWSGSYMLSWLSWQAMKVFCDELGPDCILFPDLMGQPLVDHWLENEKGLNLDVLRKADAEDYEDKLCAPTLPNRFFAVVPAEKAEELAAQAEKAVEDALQKAGKFAFDFLKPVFPEGHPDEKEWAEQLANFTECYWACTDLPDWKKGTQHIDKLYAETYEALFATETEGQGEKWKYRNDIFKAYETGGFAPNIGTFYGRFYEITEKAVGARKSLRNFRQTEESGYRCSLIPGRPALGPVGDDVLPGEYDQFWRDLYNNVQKSKRIERSTLGKNERLSVLGLTKRLFRFYLEDEINGFESYRFISTHSLAVADFKLAFIKTLEGADNGTLDQSLTEFQKNAHAILEYLNLPNEYILPKIRYKANNLKSINTAILLNFLKIPGELFQTDYFDGSFTDDLKTPQFYNRDSEKFDVQFKAKVDDLAKAAKASLRNLVNSSGSSNPSKYYAILYLDGDNMGQWLSGDNAPMFSEVLHPKAVESLVNGIEDSEKRNAELYQGWAKVFNFDDKTGKVLRDNNNNELSLKRPQAPTQHMAISRALNNYSLDLVRRIVEERFLGKLIYAGGDDVVAMVSIGEALECAETLRAAFSGHMKYEKGQTLHDLATSLDVERSSNGFIVHSWGGKEIISTTLGPRASASCGIAIAHYMYPLKQAMADARKAEKYAKNTLGRDAFAVNVVKRSGETFLSGAKWFVNTHQKKEVKEPDVQRTLITRALSKFHEAIHKNRLSPKFIVDLEEHLDVLVALDQKAVENEARRLFNQHNEGFKNSDREERETDKAFEERVKLEKQAFFGETISFLIQNADAIMLKEKQSTKTLPAKGKPADWPALRNVIKLMDMAYYIGKGGGR
ncbi:MAG: type III-B CRISPR-associated protein Cas10/Cmr2 [Balneolales bacterium]|nr:type III-B CRISPR-associated protein Cas10/Cmr2 [Balneolales bacterium]